MPFSASAAIAEPPASAAVDTSPALSGAFQSCTKPANKPKQQPRQRVILWDDNDHTYQYVIAMLQKLFAHSAEKSYQLAKEIDVTGRAVVLITTKEHAELKRDQIHACGADRLIARSKGAMSASIESE